MELAIQIFLGVGSIMGYVAFIWCVKLHRDSIKDWNSLTESVGKLKESVRECKINNIFSTDYYGRGWSQSKREYTIKQVLTLLLEKQNVEITYIPEKIKKAELKLIKQTKGKK